MRGWWKGGRAPCRNRPPFRNLPFARTLDLLHVAAARTLQAAEFVTGDDRQAKAAAKEGLKVVRVWQQSG